MTDCEWIAQKNIERFKYLLNHTAPDGEQWRVVNELLLEEQKKLKKD